MKFSLIAILVLTSLACAESYRPDGIWKAACKGDMLGVRRFMKDGASINAADPRGFTPLHHALHTFQTECVDELLDLGADPSARDAEGITPLSLCARNADEVTMRKIIATGGKIDVTDFSYPGLVWTALRYSTAEQFQLIIDAGLDVNATLRTQQGFSHLSLLHIAAGNGNTPVVELLIKNGANMEALSGMHKSTPLLSAIDSGHVATVRSLVKLGAKTDIVNGEGLGALNLAAKNRTPECLELLLAADAPVTGKTNEILRDAWHIGASAALDKLAILGLKPPAIDPIGALLSAVRANDLSAVRALCATGFYDFSKDARCVLAPAAAQGNRAILNVLHTHAGNGKHLNSADAVQVSQVQHSVIGGHFDALEFFLTNKARADHPDFSGRTPLMSAAMLGRVEMIERLAKAGVRLSAVDERGYNALDLALSHGQSDAAKTLEAHGLKATPDLAPIHTEVELPPPPKFDGPIPPITIAITPLSTTHEAWYASMASTQDFTAALQAKLEGEADTKWVERTEIDRAEKELLLNNEGLYTSSQSLAIGHWVKADVILTGSLSPDEGLGRRITLRIVDTQRGDVLALRQFIIQQPVAAPFTLTPEALRQSTDVARELIKEARLRLAATADRIVVAPLFVANRTKHTARLDLQAARLVDVFGRVAKERYLRVLNLNGTTDAHQETELSISSLAQLEGTAWQQVADHYLWGWIEEIGPQSTPFQQMPVRITFELSSGQTFSAESTVPEIESATQKLAGEVLSALPKTKEENNRVIAQRLMSRAEEWIAGQDAMPLFGSIPPWTLNRWRQSVKLLDAARFFDPGDAKIAARWLIERWNRSVYFPNDFESATTFHFWCLWQRQSDWDSHVARFGFKGFPPFDSAFFPKLPFVSGRGADDYPKRCWYGVCSDIVRKLSNNISSIPDGLPPEVRRDWLHEISAECARRFLKLVGDPDIKQPLPYDDFWIGKTAFYLPKQSRLEIAKAAFAEAKKEKAAENPDYINDMRHHLLRHFDNVGERDIGLTALSFSGLRVTDRTLPLIKIPEQTGVPKLSAKPAAPKSPRLDVRIEPLGLDGPWGDSRGYRIESAISSGGVAFLNITYQPHRKYESETMIAVWSLPGRTLSPLEPSPFSDQFRVDFFAEAPGELWVGDPKRGVSRIDLPNKRIHTFKPEDGVPFGRGKCGAFAGSEFFVSGEKVDDQPLIAAYHAQRGWRLVTADWKMTRVIKLSGFGSHLFCISGSGGKSHQVHVMDTANGTWTSPSVAAVYSSREASADVEGLWVVTEDRLVLIPTDQPASVTIPLPPDVRCGAAISPVHDGDWLWVASQQMSAPLSPATLPIHECRLMVFHKPTRTYRGCVEIPGDVNITGLIVTPERLCISTDFSSSQDRDEQRKPAPIISVNRADLIKAATAGR